MTIDASMSWYGLCRKTVSVESRTDERFFPVRLSVDAISYNFADAGNSGWPTFDTKSQIL